MKLNIGCGPHYADGWVNTDTFRDATVRPDFVVHPDYPLRPFDWGTVSHAYLGHVLEHMPWDDAVSLLDGLVHAMTDDGVVCIVGPEADMALVAWAAGRADWAAVERIIEHDTAFEEGVSRHQWNCSRARVARVLNASASGWDVTWAGTPDQLDPEWPVVSPGSPHQFAIVARKTPLDALERLYEKTFQEEAATWT